MYILRKGTQRGVFLTRGILLLREHLAMSTDMLGCRMGAGDRGELVTGTLWVEVKDAAKYPTIHNTAPHHKKNQPTQNANSSKAKKCWYIGCPESTERRVPHF